MGTVTDQITCEQCSAQAIIEFSTRTWREFVYCPRCGYGFDSEAGGPKPGHGAFAYGGPGLIRSGSITSDDPATVHRFRESLLADPELSTAILHLPPLYRSEFIRGQPEGITDLSDTQVRLIDAHLAPYGERIVAAGNYRFYTVSETASGWKVFAFHPDDDGMHVGLPEDHPTALIIQGDQVTMLDQEAWTSAVQFA